MRLTGDLGGEVRRALLLAGLFAQAALLASCSPFDSSGSDRPPGFEPWRIWLYGRPDVIRPDGKLDLTVKLEEPVESTLYDYAFPNQKITTGRRQTYRFPAGYHSRTIDFVGHVHSITLNFQSADWPAVQAQRARWRGHASIEA